jgi:hypothetical protein
MDKSKILTNVNSFQDVQKSLNEVQKILNNLSKSVNTDAESELTDIDGKNGDIKTIRHADGEYTFEVKTKEGWKTPLLGNSPILFKDKPSATAKSIKKSIDEIEVEDALTGDSRANLTTFDEKANKFILPRADYDTGWFEVDKDVLAKRRGEFTHNLNLIDDMPVHYSVYFKDTDSQTYYTNGVYAIRDWIYTNAWHGLSLVFHNGKIQWMCDSGYNLFYTGIDDGDGFNHQWVTSGSCRILVWK